MAHLKLQANKREKIGHKAKQLAREGILPAVVYSNKFESTSIQINYKEFYHLYKVAGRTSVIDLMIGDDLTLPCIVHDIDLHPVKDIPRHIDFLVVNLKEKITAPIPVVFEGEAPAVKEFGAVINIVKDELEVTALPDKLPESIIVNLETLTELSDVITIGDLISQAIDFDFVDELDTSIVSLTQAKEEADVLGSPTGGLEVTSDTGNGENQSAKKE